MILHDISSIKIPEGKNCSKNSSFINKKEFIESLVNFEDGDLLPCGFFYVFAKNKNFVNRENRNTLKNCKNSDVNFFINELCFIENNKEDIVKNINRYAENFYDMSYIKINDRSINNGVKNGFNSGLIHDITIDSTTNDKILRSEQVGILKAILSERYAFSKMHYGETYLPSKNNKDGFFNVAKRLCFIKDNLDTACNGNPYKNQSFHLSLPVNSLIKNVLKEIDVNAKNSIVHDHVTIANLLEKRLESPHHVILKLFNHDNKIQEIPIGKKYHIDESEARQCVIVHKDLLNKVKYLKENKTDKIEVIKYIKQCSIELNNENKSLSLGYAVPQNPQFNDNDLMNFLEEFKFSRAYLKNAKYIYDYTI